MADSDNESGGHGGGGSGDLSAREQDRFLPIANVSRIMKKALPANAKISKDAKETVQECVSEFISFITGEASDKCQREKRKTINGDDLLWAMTTLGFEEYVEPLKVYLAKYREMEGEKTAVGGGGGREKEGSGDGSYNGGGAGIYGGMQSPMMMIGAHQQPHHHHHSQGQMYSSGSFHQMGVGGKGSTGTSGSHGGGGGGGGASTVRSAICLGKAARPERVRLGLASILLEGDAEAADEGVEATPDLAEGTGAGGEWGRVAEERAGVGMDHRLVDQAACPEWLT
ncbi:hypothetical protein RJ640_011900 [Escallonia rubra]|uniref:Transcription factor CBF/NF-Y/archaeal histone domain-containing protein n=1 Tax=Escallonia rubra TaxID=112253 RepID=A0AA88USV5_9ASTE|nr:hypothetical protein RJ640_011900 [Escallonia rubra]